MSGTDTDDQKALKAKVAEWGPHAVPIANLQPAVLEQPPPSRYPPGAGAAATLTTAGPPA